MIAKIAAKHATGSEYSAARLILDAIATELADTGPLWSAMRTPLAELARRTAKQVRVDAVMLADEELLRAYADDLEHAARALDRETARETWARWRGVRRMRGLSTGRTEWNVIFYGMRDAVRQFRGTP